MGRRLLIVVGLLILVGGVLAAVFLLGGDSGGDEPTDEGGQTSDGGGDDGVVSQRVEDVVEIVIAIQDMPRGLVIPPDGVGAQTWPRDSLPEAGQYFLASQLPEVVGQIARTDLVRGAPILSRQLVPNLAEIASAGSDAAAILAGLPDDGRNWVAVAVPLDPSGIGQVAYGIQDGDYVDVIMSFLFVDVDPLFQTRMPNNISIITRLETGELAIGAPRQGRPEASTLTAEGVLLGPSEASQRPRLVTQRTVTDAFVVHVGYFPEGGRIFGATPTPQVVATLPPPPGEGEGEATPLPTATAFQPLIITLGVTPQDALVLAWAIDSQIPIYLALREAGDRAVVNTEPVSLDYMIRTFNATPPDALEFSLEPPITSVRRFDIGTLFSFLGSSLTIE